MVGGFLTVDELFVDDVTFDTGCWVPGLLPFPEFFESRLILFC